MDADAIIVGSGFGGAVTACRLAERGRRVIVLERGRRWDKNNYPREPGDAWWWSHEAPETHNGWLELRAFRSVAVAQGAAVGGGSLIYANVSAVPPKSVFDSGWPPEITWVELEPYYEMVGNFMNVQTVPDGQWARRTHLMKDAADKIGELDRFRKVELAVSFDPTWNYELPDARNPKHSIPFENPHGVEQGTCVHLGNCYVGCNVNAKNTLDRNYLARAERNRADVRPLHLVRGIERTDGGYRVNYEVLGGGNRRPGSATARRVVVAAGSLNSTELLLRCRDELGTLPQLSAFLGRNWSTNGDFLTPAFYSARRIDPSHGPTITSVIDFLDGVQSNKSFWIQDGGLPDLFANAIRAYESAHPRIKPVLEAIRRALDSHGPLENVMPWFAQGVDASNGRFRLRRRWWWFGRRDLALDWKIQSSLGLFEAIIAMHKRLSDATGGHPVILPSWSVANYLVTPHPLGGCGMGTGPENGVVDHKGEVFGYPDLFVIDGASIPRPVGINPSRTIAAVAERAAALMT